MIERSPISQILKIFLDRRRGEVLLHQSYDSGLLSGSLAQTSPNRMHKAPAPLGPVALIQLLQSPPAETNSP